MRIFTLLLLTTFPLLATSADLATTPNVQVANGFCHVHGRVITASTQNTGSLIRGHKPVAGIQVTLKDEATGEEFRTETRGNGDYFVAGIPASTPRAFDEIVTGAIGHPVVLCK